MLLLLLGISLAFTNCNNDDDEDLTVEITGDYLGAYGSNSIGDIDPYEIVVTRVDNNAISVRPKSGNEFDEFEIEIVRVNSSNISSPADGSQQPDKSVIFAVGIPVAITMSIDPSGDAHVFVGEKK